MLTILDTFDIFCIFRQLQNRFYCENRWKTDFDIKYSNFKIVIVYKVLKFKNIRN